MAGLASFLDGGPSSEVTILLCEEHLVTAGDLNIHVDDPHDPDSVKLLDLLQSVVLQQHITDPTQIQGGTLDLVITCSCDDILKKAPVVDRFVSHDASVYFAPLPDRLKSVEVDAAHAFHSFQPLSESNVSALICKSAKKSCPFDPMPTSLVVGCLYVLLPAISRIINLSLSCCHLSEE